MVTHLAQVAARADTHVVVDKAIVDGVTVASTAVVDGGRRVAEVARMLSGDEAERAAFRHAEELLGDAALRRGR